MVEKFIRKIYHQILQSQQQTSKILDQQMTGAFLAYFVLILKQKCPLPQNNMMLYIH